MIAIAVIGYNRPHYFKQCLASLARCEETWELPVFFCLDGGPDSRQQDYIEIIKGYKTRNYWEIMLAGENLGVGRHLYAVRNNLFQDFDEVLVVEDDVVVSPSFVKVAVRLNKWCQANYSNVGAVSTWFMNKQAMEVKKQHLRDVEVSNMNWITYLMNRKCWRSIEPHIWEYIEKFLLGRKYRERDNQGIREWMRGKVQSADPPSAAVPFPTGPQTFNARGMFNGPRFPTSQDGMVVGSMAIEGWVKVNTLVNRCRYIGEIGEHGNLGLFHNHGFPEVQLDEFEEDQTIKNFVPILRGL
jgi:hypothetical protein